jgi:hypothetical protein
LGSLGDIAARLAGQNERMPPHFKTLCDLEKLLRPSRPSHGFSQIHNSHSFHSPQIYLLRSRNSGAKIEARKIMKDNRKKKIKEIEEDEAPSRDSRGFEALAELTTSDVVAQVKMGMSVIAPIEAEEENGEDPTF